LQPVGILHCSGRSAFAPALVLKNADEGIESADEELPTPMGFVGNTKVGTREYFTAAESKERVTINVAIPWDDKDLRSWAFTDYPFEK
jgi:hypothetical protein